jgi:hypothetical protein
MFRHNILLAGAALALAAPVALAVGAAGASTQQRATAHSDARSLVVRASHPVPPGVTPRPLGNHPLLEPDPAVYAAQKRAANAAAARLTARRAPRIPRASSTLRNWAGQRDTTAAPSDSTGAIGTTRYIELVNAKVGVYSRTSNTPTASGSLLTLTGCVVTACTDSVFDPQVIWDPGTKRFFYAADDVVSSSQNEVSFGFSTTPTPTLSKSSWCRYHVNFGAKFPDYPKLGDTKDFVLVGSNNFSGNSFAGSSITWVTKPPSGSACPAASTFKAGVTGALKNANGSAAFTPVPANQTDTSSTGWAVARPASIPSGGATFLTLFKVTRSGSGTATIPVTGTPVTVRAYKMPAAAPQKGTSNKIDTLDARNTQAVSAVDPVHGKVTALWTQHAVFGGEGSQERWYEINPAAHALIQHGTVTSSSHFFFDGAVSPDRRVNGTSATFGGDMVMDVVRSSPSTLPAILIAAKVGTKAIAGLTLIASSTAADKGFDCIQDNGTCRWGDYAAATPDPASPTSKTVGEVWGSSMLSAGGSASSSGWATRNFAIRP